MPQEKPQQKLNPEYVELLRERLLRQKGEFPDDIIGPDGIRVPRAPLFRKETPVVGTDLAKTYEQLARVVPEIRGRASIITPTYTPNLIQSLLHQANFSKDRSAKTDAKNLLSFPSGSTVLGSTGVDDSAIYVQDVDPAENMDTLAHEFQHLLGFGGKGMKGVVNPMARELEADITGKLANDIFYPKKSMGKK